MPPTLAREFCINLHPLYDEQNRKAVQTSNLACATSWYRGGRSISVYFSSANPLVRDIIPKHVYHLASSCVTMDARGGGVLLPIPTSLKISVMFKNLDSLEYNCAVSEAAMYFRKAKKVFFLSRLMRGWMIHVKRKWMTFFKRKFYGSSVQNVFILRYCSCFTDF